MDNYLLRELAVLKNASHPNLVNYIGACNEVSEVESNLNALYIVIEYDFGVILSIPFVFDGYMNV